MIRIPAGHSWGPYLAGERVGLTGVGIHLVSSATWAPSRGVPSLSSAATQACSGIVWIAACTGPWAGNPMEYCSPASVMWCKNAFDAPPASARTSTWPRSPSGSCASAADSTAM
jgi:hypothetical protein